MAEFVQVADGDTISSIIACRKRPQCHEMHSWIEKIIKVNPHIGNPDRINPNDTLLIPDNLNEHISEDSIWHNALGHAPPQPGFHPPMCHEIPVEVIQSGDTIERLANEAFKETRYSNAPESVKRAIFLHNNPRLYFYKSGRSLPIGTLANMTPFMLPKNDVAGWERANPILQGELIGAVK